METKDSEPNLGYLGFILDEEKCRITRRGYEPTWKDLTPLDLQILKRLLEHEGRFCPRDRIRDAWPAAARDIPDAGAIDIAMTRLRGKIESLGVTVEGKRLHGLRLIEMPDQVSAPASSGADPQG